MNNVFPILLHIGGKGYYGVRIVNGKILGAGTTGVDVYLTLVGDRGATGKVSLLGYLKQSADGIDAGTYDDFLIETAQPLGDVKVVGLGIPHTPEGDAATDSTWFVQYTNVYDILTEFSEDTRFPCYQWIEEKELVTTTSKTGIMLSSNTVDSL